jgi:hypothetical protein
LLPTEKNVVFQTRNSGGPANENSCPLTINRAFANIVFGGFQAHFFFAGSFAVSAPLSFPQAERTQPRFTLIPFRYYTNSNSASDDF